MKPHVICHMAASVDGKTLLSRWKPEGRVAAGLFERLHDELDGDSWLVGRVTGQEFAKGSAYSASAGGGFHRGLPLDPHHLADLRITERARL